MKRGAGAGKPPEKTADNRGGAVLAGAPLTIRAGVIREIRQHAHSSMKAEICGVLLGAERNGTTEITAAIAGANAEEGGAHVTFTQETWAHIYKIKDRDYPEERIMGWYHSHPGFGVFFSEHDTFIHRNFFSGPQQVAWVFDPHSDEEGCFGWEGDRIKRLQEFAVVDERGGGFAEESGRAETAKHDVAEENERTVAISDVGEPQDKLTRLLVTVTSHLCALALGIGITWFLFPKILVWPVVLDPLTGMPVAAPPRLIPLEQFRRMMPPLAEAPQRPPEGGKGAVNNGAK